jgi:hypothetical protein
MSAPRATAAGFTVSVRGRSVYLVDTEQGRDPGMSHHEKPRSWPSGSGTPPPSPRASNNRGESSGDRFF